mmetsp:Transcript_42177/g.68318  ORF Transcript_42177/g.68318 Transcript_42177/m.68318 type:complete len:505 (+) Transcript_42177:104-1618(+)
MTRPPVGQMSGMRQPMLLIDPLSDHFPVIAASAGFCSQTGRPAADCIGPAWDLLVRGVPEVLISKSSKKNFLSYCHACASPDLDKISEVLCIQPCALKEGVVFASALVLSLCRHPSTLRPYVLMLLIPIVEGVGAYLSMKVMAQMQEEARDILQRKSGKLFDSSTRSWLTQDFDGETLGRDMRFSKCAVEESQLTFFGERLQGQSLLRNGSRTAARREPGEVPRGCLVFSDRPVRPTGEGLRFRVHVDGVTGAFSGLPVLGFTRRRPEDSTALYPEVTKCLGASVLIGGLGEAWARDKESHLELGFKKPLAEELEEFHLEPEVPLYKRKALAELCEGDVLECCYTWEGRIQMMLNGQMLMDVDVRRPLDAREAYYVVVDVSSSATSMTLLFPKSSSLLSPPEASGVRFGSRSSPEVSGKVFDSLSQGSLADIDTQVDSTSWNRQLSDESSDDWCTSSMAPLMVEPSMSSTSARLSTSSIQLALPAVTLLMAGAMVALMRCSRKA